MCPSLRDRQRRNSPGRASVARGLGQRMGRLEPACSIVGANQRVFSARVHKMIVAARYLLFVPGNRHVTGTHVGTELGPTHGILSSSISYRYREHCLAGLFFFTDLRRR